MIDLNDPFGFKVPTDLIWLWFILVPGFSFFVCLQECIWCIYVYV